MSSPACETLGVKVLSSESESESESVNLMSQDLRVPQFMPHKVMLWFKLLEARFMVACITKEETKFDIVVANIGEKYIEQVEDILLNPHAAGKYEFLKQELCKRLTELDNSRVRKLLEDEKIGDRTPSQFFYDLKKLATSSISDDFLITLWRSRLPANMQRVLDAISDKTASVLIEMADRINEIYPEQEQLLWTSKDDEINALRSRIELLELHVKTISRTRSRSVSRNRMRNRCRSYSPSRTRGRYENPTWCWYHTQFQYRARKCRAPCGWMDSWPCPCIYNVPAMDHLIVNFPN